MRRPLFSPIFSLFLATVLGACVHHIHVSPTPEVTASDPLPITVKVEVPFLAVEGADHMPGIAMFTWPAVDLRDAVVSYAEKRGTFAAVGSDAGDIILVVKAWMTLRAPDRYLYRVHLEADLSPPHKPSQKTYAADAEAMGSTVRWVTASDEEPINSATNIALDQLFSQIEADQAALRHLKSSSR